MTFVAKIAIKYPIDNISRVCKNISVIDGIISKLKGIQKDKGLSDREMAEKLGCSRQLYQMTRSGKIPLRHKVLQGISIAFPELQPDILFFLSSNANKLPNEANTNDTSRLRP